ncbi:helix-turn-helix domain-containing protein [Mumia zhuanghuii]|nr:helix-turn-helix domain-containing protein [Mumia zhuanghuii]
MIALAVQSAVDHYLDLLEGRPVSGHRVDELFRRMGRAEAMDGRGIDAVRAACQIASRDAWRELRSAACGDELSDDLLGPLGDTLFDYLQHLVDQVHHGYVTARQKRAPARVRHQLMQAMLTGRPAEDVRRLADLAEWELPTKCVALVADFPEQEKCPSEVPRHLLLDIFDGHVVAVVAATRVDEGRAALKRMPITSSIAVSWAVPVADVRHAYRWTRRALSLVRGGWIERTDVIDCADYRGALWLHADPALRRELCDELLAPLLAKTRHQRATLAQTLLLWLRGHEPAAVIAEQMDVHEQTVRRRLRHLKSAFAPVLDEPEQKTALLMVLESVAPAWLKEAPTANKRGDVAARGGVS